MFVIWENILEKLSLLLFPFPCNKPLCSGNRTLNAAKFMSQGCLGLLVCHAKNQSTLSKKGRVGWGRVIVIKIEQCPKFHPIGGGFANKSNANGKTRVGQKQSVPGE